MPPVSPRPIRLLAPLLVLAGLAALAAMPSLGTGASSATIVTALVPSAISLQDSCTATPARSFGTVLPGAPVTTATGAGVCRFTFTSTNDSSMLRLYQSDRSTQAMVGTTPGYSWHGSGGSDKDLARSGTALMMIQDSWNASGTYARSIDAGDSWQVFNPGGGSTPHVAVASSTVAWRFGSGVVRRSTNMQDPTPTWTAIGTSLAGGGSVEALDADAVDANVAWVAHYDGVFRTADAGATPWSVAWPGGCLNPSVIDATSASTAFVVGWGTICRTTNSNASWSTVMTGLSGFDAIDVQGSPQTATTIWTVGTGGRVARSTNNGTNWSMVTPVPIPVDLMSIDVVSDNEAVVSGYDGLAYRTTNAGSSWTRVRLPNSGTTHAILSPTNSIIVASNAYGGAMATKDGGDNWTAPNGQADTYTDIDSVDATTLIMTLGRGRIARSTNGGTSRTTINTGIGNINLRGVAMLDSDSWIAVGEQGTIVITEDGGSTWSTRPSGTTEDLWDVDVTSEHVAIAVGSGGTILRSADGGWNWETRSSTGGHLARVEIGSGTPGIAVGFDGVIRRSIDDGITWTTPASPTTGNITSVSVVSDDTVYAATYGKLLKSVDGGATWTTRNVGGMTRVDAVDENVVWMTTAYWGGWDQWANLSYDGGQTWVVPFGNQNPDVMSIHALDTGTVFFGGDGEALRKTNAAPTIPDYAAGGWTTGTSLFGACLQDLSGGAQVATWTEDASGTCTASDSDNWYAVPTAPVKVAQMPAAGTGTVDIVWGFRAGPGLAKGTYVAAVTVEAIAPNG